MALFCNFLAKIRPLKASQNSQNSKYKNSIFQFLDGIIYNKYTDFQPVLSILGGDFKFSVEKIFKIAMLKTLFASYRLCIQNCNKILKFDYQAQVFLQSTSFHLQFSDMLSDFLQLFSVLLQRGGLLPWITLYMIWYCIRYSVLSALSSIEYPVIRIWCRISGIRHYLAPQAVGNIQYYPV